MKRIIFFVLLLIPELFSLAQNLVLNPGFETWSSKTKPAGWTTTQNCLKDSVYINAGSYSCQHSGGTGTTKYLGQTISVVPGKQYNLSFFYKTEITGTGNGCRIWCYWKDSEGISIADPMTDDILRSSRYLKSDTWLQSGIIATAPVTAVAFYLEVRTYSNSIAYWDDFVFEENPITFNYENKLPNVIIYPNPASEYLIVSNIQNLKYIEIESITGVCLWKSTFSGESVATMPVSDLREGLYIIIIQTDNSLIIRKFIIKTK
jgi:hypothetical protein